MYQYPGCTHLQVMFKNDYEDFIVLIRRKYLYKYIQMNIHEYTYLCFGEIVLVKYNWIQR